MHPACCYRAYQVNPFTAGIWDGMTSDACVRLVRQRLRRPSSAGSAADQLVREAAAVSPDNLTAIVVQLAEMPRVVA